MAYEFVHPAFFPLLFWPTAFWPGLPPVYVVGSLSTAPAFSANLEITMPYTGALVLGQAPASATSYGVHNMGAYDLEDAPNMGAFEDADVFAAVIKKLVTGAAFSVDALAITPVFTTKLEVTDVLS